MRWFRNTNTDEVHQVHDDGASKEECNLDAIRAAEHLDELSEEEVLADLAANPGHGCGHCLPKEAVTS